MQQKNNHNMVHKNRHGRFTITIWRSNRESEETSPTENGDSECQRESFKACIQHGRFDSTKQTWQNQQIWVYSEELKDLREALKEMEELQIPFL